MTAILFFGAGAPLVIGAMVGKLNARESSRLIVERGEGEGSCRKKKKKKKK